MSYPSSHRTSRSSLSAPRVGTLATLLFSAILLTASFLSAGSPALVPTNLIPELGQSEIQMWSLINQARLTSSVGEETKGGARPLEWDSRLAAVARAHSEEMAAEGFFSHQGLNGSLPDVRVSKAGVKWTAIGENIAKYQDVVEAHAAFMDEPKFQHNHRENILSSKFTHVGIGIAKGADGFLYITQEFAALR